MRIALLFLLFLYQNLLAQPIVSSGKIVRLENFHSQFVDARNVDVWLPQGYNTNEQYAVLYMHDGQMLFDSTTTWNHQEWKVDETIARLIQADSIRKCIVVGIWNSGKNRHIDYFPQKPFESLPASIQDSIYQAVRSTGASVFSGKVQSDAYLKFVVKELKPFIDSAFSVRHDAKNTFIAGSSMGGLISLYAMCEYPEVFGGAACLSTHWPGIFSLDNNPIPVAFMRYLKNHLPSPKNHQLYFDAGTATLDSLYKPFQQQADQIVRSKGYHSKQFLSIEFVGADHSEKSWANRFSIPVTFLLASQKKK